MFPPGAWLLKGELPQDQPVPEDLDLLLLTQGLPDHSHPDTLRILDKTSPLWAPQLQGRWFSVGLPTHQHTAPR